MLQPCSLLLSPQPLHGEGGGGNRSPPASNKSIWGEELELLRRGKMHPPVKPRLKNGNMKTQMKSSLLWKKSY